MTEPPPSTATDPTTPAVAPAPPGPRPLDDNPACDWPEISAAAVDVTSVGATPDDDLPDTAAFTAAVAQAGVGGMVVGPAGRFDLETDYVPWSGAYAFALLDNTIGGAAGHGLRLHVADRNVVTGNTVSGSAGAAQIELDAASDNQVVANTRGPSGADFGVWIHGRPSVANEVRDNVLTGGYADEPIRDEGDGTLLSGNVD